MRSRERFTVAELDRLIDRAVENQPCPCALCWRAAVRREVDLMQLRMPEELVEELAYALAVEHRRTKRWWCGR